MIVDIEKVGEDEKRVCYAARRDDHAANVFVVEKVDGSVSLLIGGDPQSAGGAEFKIKKSVRAGTYPDQLQLATG